MQEFFINQNSTLPLLKMELINDGRNDYKKFHEMIQNADITFTMTNVNNNVIKISNKPAFLMLKEDSCDEEYYICYAWSVKDTKITGKYKGTFTIKFGSVYGGGTLIAPIQEELIINIQ